MTHSAHDCGVILNAMPAPIPTNPPPTAPISIPPPRSRPPYKLAVLKDGVEHAQPEVQELQRP